ncbi:MAG: hypothetical protein PSX80_09510, partial [bacterium]|nr:hypothetical protein [bacterium]
AEIAQQQIRLSNDAQGYSFGAPKDWLASESGEGFGIVNPAKTILIAVKAHGYKDFVSFIADANLERDGLELVGKPQEVKSGQIFRTVKRSPQGMAVIDTALVFSGSGGGIVVVSITDEANAATGFNTAAAIANSIQFFQPKVLATAEKVRSLLAGKRLLYLFTGNGYSERKDVVLCSNGVFYQSLDMGGFSPGNVDGPSFAATGGKRGRWSVSANGTTLVMAFDTAGTVQYTLSARQASNEVGMNGQRWFVQSQTVCR